MTIWLLVALAKDLLANTEASQHIQNKKNLPVPRVMEKQNIDNMFRWSQRSHHRILSTDSKVATTFQETIFSLKGWKG